MRHDGQRVAVRVAYSLRHCLRQPQALLPFAFYMQRDSAHLRVNVGVVYTADKLLEVAVCRDAVCLQQVQQLALAR